MRTRRIAIIGCTTVLAHVAPPALAGTTWDGGGGDNLWGTGANWNDNSAPATGSTVDLTFAGTNRLSPNNNYTNYDDFRNIDFASGAGAFTISGNAIDLFGRIENQSTNTQTVSLAALALQSGQPKTGEFNPVSGNLIINSPNIYTNGNTVQVWGNNGKTVTFNGVISQGGGLTVNQNSTVVLTAANTYTGTTTVSAGTLAVANASALGTGSLVLGGGNVEFRPQAGLNITDLPGSANFGSYTPSNSVTTDFTSLHSTNTGLWSENTTRAYSGQIYLITGTWSFGEGFDDSVHLKIGSTGILNDTVWNTPTNGKVTIASDGWYDIDLRVGQGVGGVGPYGSNNWTSGKGVGIVMADTTSTDGNTYTAFGYGALGTDLRLRDVASYGVGNTVTLNSAASLAVTESAMSVTLSGTVGGTGALTKSGPGTLLLSGTNTFTGATTVSAGKLAVTSTSFDSTGISIASGATFSFANASETIIGYHNTTNHQITGAGTLMKEGAGIVEISANGRGTTISLSSGALIDIQGGTLRNGGFQNASWTSNLADLNIAAGATFDTWNGAPIRVDALTGSGSIVNGLSGGTTSLTLGVDNGSGTFSGAISAVGLSLVKAGTGNQVLAAGSTFTGNVTVDGGTLRASAVGALGQSSSSRTITVNNGGTLDLAAQTVLGNHADTTIPTLVVNSGGTAITTGGYNTLNNVTLDGGTLDATSGWGGLFRSWSINGTITSTGTSTIKDSTGGQGIALQSGAGTRTNVDVQSGTLTISAAVHNGNTSDGNPQWNRATNLSKLGAGTLVLSGTNTYTGETVIGGGVLNVASLSDYGVASAIGARTAAQENTGDDGIGLHFKGGTLQYTGSTAQSTNRQIRILNGSTGATIDASGTNPNATLSFTYSGANTNLFDSPGTRTLTLTGSNTGTNVFALQLTDQSGNATSLAKTGGGTWVLSGASTYTGATTVSAGRLVMGDASTDAFATSGVTVASGATMGGSGTISGGTLDVSGMHAPGNSIGLQTVQNVNYNSNSIFEWEMDYGASPGVGTRGTNYDAVNVNGQITGPGGAVFRIVLPGSGTFSDTFWANSLAWSDIFSGSDSSVSTWTNRFSSGTLAFFNANGTITSPNPDTQGYFTLNGSTLNWTPVPELSNLLAGVLLGAGLLRRRRP